MNKNEMIEIVKDWFLDDGIFSDTEIIAICEHRSDAESIMRNTVNSGIKAICGKQHEIYFVVKMK